MPSLAGRSSPCGGVITRVSWSLAHFRNSNICRRLGCWGTVKSWFREFPGLKPRNRWPICNPANRLNAWLWGPLWGRYQFRTDPVSNFLPSPRLRFGDLTSGVGRHGTAWVWYLLLRPAFCLFSMPCLSFLNCFLVSLVVISQRLVPWL